MVQVCVVRVCVCGVGRFVVWACEEVGCGEACMCVGVCRCMVQVCLCVWGAGIYVCGVDRCVVRACMYVGVWCGRVCVWGG